MKDILKVMGTYFAVGFGALTGVGAGMKVCDKILNGKSKKENTETEKVIKFTVNKESE